MKFFLSLAFVLLASMTSQLSYAQSTKQSVVIGTMTSRPNALLVLNPPGANQGFLLPQLTTAARLSIHPSSSEDGLVVFDISEKEFYYWKNDEWVKGLGSSDQSLSFDTETLELTLSDGNTVQLSQLKEIPTQAGNAGKFITTDGSRLSWATVESIAGAASGDLSGTYPSPKVSKLQGNSVSASVLDGDDTGKVLVWNGTQWTPQVVSGVSATAQSYSIDPSDFHGVRRNGGPADKANAMIFEDNTTFVTVFKRDEAAEIMAPIHLPDGAIVQQILLYYMDRDSRDLTLYVARKTFTGGNENMVSPWTSSGNSSSIQTSTHTPTAATQVIDNSLYSYRVIIDLEPSADANNSSEATHRVYGLQVKYLK